MGIDGIGKPIPGPPPVSLEPGGSRPLSGPQAPFSVGSAAPVAAPMDGPLARLERGEIGLDQYLDQRVEAATAHLSSLDPEDLSFIRQTLRAELGRDPALVELVRRAAGAVPVDPQP